MGAQEDEVNMNSSQEQILRERLLGQRGLGAHALTRRAKYARKRGGQKKARRRLTATRRGELARRIAESPMTRRTSPRRRTGPPRRHIWLRKEGSEKEEKPGEALVLDRGFSSAEQETLAHETSCYPERVHQQCRLELGEEFAFHGTAEELHSPELQREPNMKGSERKKREMERPRRPMFNVSEGKRNELHRFDVKT